jgi:hypothetical protein
LVSDLNPKCSDSPTALLANSGVRLLSLGANRCCRLLTLPANVLTLFANCSAPNKVKYHFASDRSSVVLETEKRDAAHFKITLLRRTETPEMSCVPVFDPSNWRSSDRGKRARFSR